MIFCHFIFQATPSHDPKPPKPPSKPVTAYIRYSKAMFNSVKAKNPNLMVGGVGRIIGQMWKDLTVEEKDVYHQAYLKDKVGFTFKGKNPQNIVVFNAKFLDSLVINHMNKIM